MIIEKPWGSEEIIEINKYYVVKLLKMNASHKCSIQYHEKKVETIYVISGELRIYVGESLESLESRIYFPGESITLNRRVIHRMEAVVDSSYLEASTPELDDVVRLKDEYNRK